MEKLKVILIMILAVIALGLVGIVAYFITTGNGLSGFHIGRNTTLAKESSINMKDITSLEIDYTKNYFDVYIYESDSQELVIKEYMPKELEQDKLAKIDTNGSGNLYIKGTRINSGFFWFNSGGGYVEVYVPKDYNGSLSAMTSSGEIIMDQSWISEEDIYFTSSSGNIRVNDIIAKKITITASSGNIYADSLSGSRNIVSSSGNIKILGGSGDSDMATNSGNIYIKDQDGKFNISASSGKINLIDGNGYGRVTSSSGNVVVELDEVLGNIDLNSSSGNVILRIPENSKFSFEAHTSSGDINTFFDNNLTYNKKGDYASGIIGEYSEISITINTSSGNVKISKK